MTFLYEYGYASTFRMPPALISPNLTTVFCVGMSLISFCHLPFLVRSELRNAALYLPVKAFLLLLIISPGLLIGFVAGCIYLPFWVLMVLCICIVTVTGAIPPIIAYCQRNVLPEVPWFAAYKTRCRASFAGWTSQNTSASRYCLHHPIFVFFLVIAGFFIPMLVGHGLALHQKEYLVPSDMPDSVVLRQYGDVLVCAKFDRAAGLIYPEFVILPVAEKNRILMLEDIGVLSPALVRPSHITAAASRPFRATSQPKPGRSQTVP